MNPKIRLAVVAALVVSMTGCATTSPMLQPSVVMAERYDEPAIAGGIAVSPDWWQRFGSPAVRQRDLADREEVLTAEESGNSPGHLCSDWRSIGKARIDKGGHRWPP